MKKETWKNQIAWLAAAFALGTAQCAFAAEPEEPEQGFSREISPDGRSWVLTADRVYTEVSDGKIPETLVVLPDEENPDGRGAGTDSEALGSSGEADSGVSGSSGETDSGASGSSGGIRLALRSAEILREYWKGDVEICLTLHRYGSDSYTFGDVSVPAEAAEPDPGGLLPAAERAVDADPSTLRLLTCAWAGEAYRDEDGVLCRDARILGERKLSDIRGVYSGTVRRKMPEESVSVPAESGETEAEETTAAETLESSAPSRTASAAASPVRPATAAEPMPPENAPSAPASGRGFLHMAAGLIRRLLESRTVRVSLSVLLLAAAGTAVFLYFGRKLGRAWHRDRK